MPEENIENGIRETSGDSVPQKSEALFEMNESGPAEKKIEFFDGGSEQAEKKFDEILSMAPAASAVSAAHDDAAADAKSVGEAADEESRIRMLLDIASTKGVVHAVKVARSLGDYYALDRMHDELAGKLYEGLVERRLIEKE